MPHYLIRATYTPETWARLIKNPNDRQEAARAALAQVGGKLEAFYFAFGETDAYIIFEAPDNVAASALSLAVGSSGAMSSFVTTVLLTPAEALSAMTKAGKVAYRAPGS